MSVSFFQRLRQTGFGWLLGLSLVLPLAQTAAAAHAISHLGEPARQTQRDKNPLPHEKDCPLCQMAAAIGAGGLPATPLCWIPPDLEPMPAVPAMAAAWLAPVTVAYRSRAPPCVFS